MTKKRRQKKKQKQATTKYDVTHRLKNRVAKGVLQETRLRVNGSECKMFTSIKFYVKVQQHFSARILY